MSEAPVDVPSGNQIGLANANFNVDLGSALSGGTSYRKLKRDTRTAYEYALRFQPQINRANNLVNEEFRNRELQGKVADAKAAGLHPLFALGANASVGGAGGAPGFNIQGQSSTGSHRDIGAMLTAAAGPKPSASDAKLKKNQIKLSDIEVEHAQLALNAAKNNLSGNQAQTPGVLKEMKQKGSAITHAVPEKIKASEGVIELKPAEQTTTAVGDPSTSAATMAIKRKLVYNKAGDHIYIPNVEDLDSLMEEPLTAGGIIAAMNPDKTLTELKNILTGKVVQQKRPDGSKTIFNFGLFGKDLFTIRRH